MTERKVENPFTLTAREERILVLKRQGLSDAQIGALTGFNGKGGVIAAVVEKDRLRILADKERPGAAMTLRHARGRNERSVDPRRGKWKEAI